MEIITDLKEANTLLQSYYGAKAQLWMLTSSLKRLALKLQLSNANEIIFIIGIGCGHISGHFQWKNADLAISVEIHNESNEKVTKIIDKLAGFELITTGGFSLAKGTEDDFGTSFIDFIK